MRKVQIFVAMHKPGARCLEDGVFVPIHVGRAEYVRRMMADGRSGLDPDDPMADMIGDDTGENISEKNPSYCEMTAHYWIWKNVKDTEYVGLCHYRRFFGVDVTEESIDSLMQDVDVILVEPSYYVDSVFSYFAKFMGAENMTILSLVMKRRCPDFYETLEKICDGIKFYPFNMLLCRKPLFNEYCEWMFGILSECERYVKPAPYINARRALAYMAEMLTGVYFIHRQLRIKIVPYEKIEDDQKVLMTLTDEEKKRWTQLESLLQHELADQVIANRKEKFDNPAILLGLKKDYDSI
jgi:hypothetical protein